MRTQTRKGVCRSPAVVMTALLLSGLSSAGFASDDDGTVDLDTVTVHGYQIERQNFGYVGSFQIIHSAFESGDFSFVPGGFTPVGGKNAAEDKCNEAANPVIFSTGNKVEREVEFTADGEMPLTLTRTYNHNADDIIPLFGPRWLSSFDYQVSYMTNDYSECYNIQGEAEWSWCGASQGVSAITAHRPDGRRVLLLKSADGKFYEDKPSPVTWAQVLSDGSIRLSNEAGGTELYDRRGFIRKISNANGVSWTYAYAGPHGNTLASITHSGGRRVAFQFNSTNNSIKSVTDPAGAVYEYAVINRPWAGRRHYLLSTVKRPGDTTPSTLYHYELATALPGALTGKSIGGVRFSTFNYDAEGRATLSEHSGIEKNTFTYAPSGSNVLTVTQTNPLGKKTNYRFVDGKLTSATGLASANCPASYREITYDANGYRNLVTDFNGNVTDFDYNAKGQLLKKTEAAGTPIARVTEYTWDPTKNRVVGTKLVGVRQETYQYDANNRLASVTTKNLSPHGVANQSRTTTYTYTYHAPLAGQTIGELATKTVNGPLPGSGDSIITTYSREGNLLSIRNSLGHRISYELHNGRGQPGREIGVNGKVTEYTYDSLGRVTRVRTFPNGVNPADVSYFYGSNRLVSRVLSADGVSTHFEYDVAHRLIKQYRDLPGILDAGFSREQQVIGYNNASDVVSVRLYGVLPAGTATMTKAEYFDYDELSRILGRRGANGRKTNYAYDDNGNVVKITDALGRATEFTVDALNRMSTSTDELGGVTKFGYNPAGQLVKVTDPRNNSTVFVYDGFGQLWARTSPDTGSISIAYDAAGQRTQLTEAGGSSTTYTYDSLGRLIAESEGGYTVTRTYDVCASGKGMLCKINNLQGEIGYAYNAYGNITSRSEKIGSSNIIFGQSYAYDSVGRLNGVSYPGGVSVGYGYASGQVAAVSAIISGATRQVATSVKYRPFGALSGFTYGNGLSRKLYYDQNYVAGDERLTGITTMNGGTTLQSLLLSYAANDQITKITNYVNSTHLGSYQYDELGRLTREANAAGSSFRTYSYDENGNRTRLGRSGGQGVLVPPLNYHVQPSSNRLSAIGGNTYAYDLRGNVLAAGALEFAYDGWGYVTSASRDGVTTTYLTNPFGLRSYKTPASTGTATGYLYGPSGQLEVEYNWGGQGWTHYIRLKGEIVGFVRSGALHAVHSDHAGRAEIITNGSKAVVWRANNSAFSRTVSLDSVGGYNMGLPGQYWDAETGLWYNMARYFDGEHGRFLQSDPSGLVGGANTFSFASNNPVSLVDPQGLTGCVVSFPGYWIQVPNSEVELPLAHAGVLSYGEDGKTRYYEYGRYRSDFGNVERRAVTDLVKDENGEWTQESQDKLKDRLREIGEGHYPLIECHKKADAEKVNAYAEKVMRDANRPAYNWNPLKGPTNTCLTFASDAVRAGL